MPERKASCQGRGRGFEPLRPLQKFKDLTPSASDGPQGPSAHSPRNSFAARSRNAEKETAAPTAIGTAGNELGGHLGGLTETETTPERARAQWSLLFVNMHHGAAEPALPLVAAARARSIEVRDRVERGEFEREPRADFAARLARVEFGAGIRRRAR